MQDEELIERAARYVLDNSRKGKWRDSANDHQCAADDAKLMEAYRDIIGKTLTFLAADRLEALAQPVVGVEGLRQKLRMIVSHATVGGSTDIDASINDICVRISASRNMIYEAGKEAGAKAALAASPSPVVGDREAIGREDSAAKIVADRSLLTDDAMLRRIEALASLSTPVVGGGADSLVDAATGGRFSNLTAFTEAMLSADDERSLDELVGEAATLLHALAGSLPDPHTMDRVGMMQEVDDA